MVFLHPTVMRDASATRQASMDRYQAMRALQGTAQPDSGWLPNPVDAPAPPAPPATDH
jgi:type II secretory pathway component GspD/PulD (secretin)